MFRYKIINNYNKIKLLDKAIKFMSTSLTEGKWKVRKSPTPRTKFTSDVQGRCIKELNRNHQRMTMLPTNLKLRRRFNFLIHITVI